MTTRRILLLAVNAALLTTLVAVLRDDGSSTAGPVSVNIAARENATTMAYEPIAASASKPLFRVKQALAVPTEIKVVVAQAAPTFRLAGVVWSDAEKLAVVQLGDRGGHQRIRLNDQVEGWTLVELGPKSASFAASEANRITLMLTAGRPASE